MTRSILFALLTLSTFTSVDAEAQGVVRDHRTESAPQATGNVSIQPSVRYRRRPGPRFMLPLKVDLGAAGSGTRYGFAPGVAGAIGIHWASMSPGPTSFDIGLGVFGGFLGAPGDGAAMDESRSVAYGGSYLELGRVLSQGTAWRTWASARGEYLSSSAFDETHRGVGASARLSAELFASGAGIEPRGIFLGTYALGVYVEAGARDMVDGVGMFQVTGGLTFRTPTVFMP